MMRRRFYNHPFFILGIVIALVVIINFRLFRQGEVEVSIENRRDRGVVPIVRRYQRYQRYNGGIKSDTSVISPLENSGKDLEKGNSDRQWLEDTKALLYQDVAKDGLASEESFVKSYLLAKANLTRRCNLWKQQTDTLLQRMVVDSSTDDPKYFLAAVLYIRIYEEDKAKLTTREVLQWIRFHLYAGVDHIYLYDSYVTADESQEKALQPYIQAGFVSYFDWHEHNPYDLHRTHLPAYQHSLDNFKQDMLWQMAFDMDEFPYSPVDKDPGFLARFVKRFKERHPDVTEMTLDNYLILGSPDLNKDWLLERIFRETKKPGNHLVKPIYIAKNVRSQLHHNSLLAGTSSLAPADEIRFKHYWCARLQDWGADTQNTLDLTTPEYGILDISYVLRKCQVEALPHPY